MDDDPRIAVALEVHDLHAHLRPPFTSAIAAALSLAAPYSPLSTLELRQDFVDEARHVVLRVTAKALYPAIELRTADKDLASNLVVREWMLDVPEMARKGSKAQSRVVGEGTQVQQWVGKRRRHLTAQKTGAICGCP